MLIRPNPLNVPPNASDELKAAWPRLSVAQQRIEIAKFRESLLATPPTTADLYADFIARHGYTVWEELIQRALAP